mmetsp:Transcript_1903/g.5731  ORF Transcript_1903/g.5731 Transcript_1903/m.5731 type:complete len:118 (-) Transcript_1903:2720-3073(-)
MHRSGKRTLSLLKSYELMHEEATMPFLAKTVFSLLPDINQSSVAVDWRSGQGAFFLSISPLRSRESGITAFKSACEQLKEANNGTCLKVEHIVNEWTTALDSKQEMLSIVIAYKDKG